MFVIYAFCAGIGLAFTLMPWLFVNPAPIAEAPAESSVPIVSPHVRYWSVPMCFFGVLGVTLHLLGRPFITGLLYSALAGIPAGLLATWVGERFK